MNREDLASKASAITDKVFESIDKQVSDADDATKVKRGVVRDMLAKLREVKTGGKKVKPAKAVAKKSAAKKSKTVKE